VTEVWDLITSRPGLWLGEGAAVDLAEGTPFRAPGLSGEIRVVKPGDRLRLSWQAQEWPAPATLQLTLSETESGKTAIQAHLERLPDAGAQEAMRTRWRETLERIAAAAES
jgi:uncharacterized protein YndB with AHSA1/START domain